jgi:hypothetical protein
VAPEETPIVILFGKQLLRNPSNVELAAEIGLPAPVQAETVRDLIVVGAGAGRPAIAACSRLAPCSSSSGRRPPPIGSAARWRSTRTGSS